MGYFLVAKEALWLRSLLYKLGYNSTDGLLITLYDNNQPAISLIKNAEHHHQTKHIDIH